MYISLSSVYLLKFFSLPSLSTHHSVILLSLLYYSLLSLHALSFSSMLILSLFLSLSFKPVYSIFSLSMYSLSLLSLFYLFVKIQESVTFTRRQFLFSPNQFFQIFHLSPWVNNRIRTRDNDT